MIDINYDSEIDALYANLGEGKYVDSDVIVDDIILDYDDKGNVLGVEILNLNRHSPDYIKVIYNYLTKEQAAILQEYFICRPE